MKNHSYTKSSGAKSGGAKSGNTESFFSFFSPCISVHPLCISVFPKKDLV